jgi:two-component system, NarL family, response regulator DesR
MANFALIRVLIADDQRLMRTWISSLLARETDIQVIGEAVDGNQALTLARQLHPDILLLDIEMPGLDGIQVARIVQAENVPVCILVLSSYSEENYIQMVKELGISAYLVKENAPALLAGVIRKIVGEKADCPCTEAIPIPQPATPNYAKTHPRAV